MLINQAIMEVLKRHSSEMKTEETKPLSQAQIYRYLIQEFFDELGMDDETRGKLTARKVRYAIDKMIETEANLPDENKKLRYSVAIRKDGKEYKSNYWTPKQLSDLELKFLI